MRKLGDRLPCRICGADRTGQPENSHSVAICRDCWPEYWRNYNTSRFIPLYLGRDLKAQVDVAAAERGVTVAEYVRGIIKSALSGLRG